jgi:glycosyltransferase involved in cell wall biosynthesis
MKVLAIICAYNEADIIGWTVRHLKRQGCDVLVIDCESTDETVMVAHTAGAEILRHPAPPVSWHELLRRVEKIAAGSNADWCMLCDADELRYASPYLPIATLAQAFVNVQEPGYNAVDFQVLTFHPTFWQADSEEFIEWEATDEFDGQDPEQYFRFYSGDPLNQRIGQVKAWRNVGPVSLAASGGHQVQFPGRRVYPVKFLSKHYPIRSQAHGERKVFEERKWLDQSQGRHDWHVQYNGIVPGHSFLKDPKYLMEWDK